MVSSPRPPKRVHPAIHVLAAPLAGALAVEQEVLNPRGDPELAEVAQGLRRPVPVELGLQCLASHLVEEAGRAHLLQICRPRHLHLVLGEPDEGRAAVFGIAFSADGRRLASTSTAWEPIKLWDVGTRQEVLTLTGIGGTLPAAVWSADGDVILAGAPWQAWLAPTWEEINAAEAKEKAEGQQP